jgi:hypothetical protein
MRDRSGPVRSFVVPIQAGVVLAVQKRGYVGYPLTFSIRTQGLEDGAPVVIERRAGGRWARVTGGTVRKNRAGMLGLLPKGNQNLRVTAQIGDQRFVCASRTVRVEKARRWTTARDTGRYSGTPEAAFRITRGGRELRDFRASVVTYCITNTGIGGTTLEGLAPVPRATIAPDGRFYGFSDQKGTVATVQAGSRGGRSPAPSSSRSASASAAERSASDASAQGAE